MIGNIVFAFIGLFIFAFVLYAQFGPDENLRKPHRIEVKAFGQTIPVTIGRRRPTVDLPPWAQLLMVFIALLIFLFVHKF